MKQATQRQWRHELKATRWWSNRLEVGSDSAYQNLVRVFPFATSQGEYDNGTVSTRGLTTHACIDAQWSEAVSTYLEISSYAPGDERM